jgi:hypothetical protein
MSTCRTARVTRSLPGVSPYGLTVMVIFFDITGGECGM